MQFNSDTIWAEILFSGGTEQLGRLHHCNEGRIVALAVVLSNPGL